MATRIKLRNDTAANFTAENPVLGKGEFGVELAVGVATRKVKIGDGVAAWNALDYAFELPESFPTFGNVEAFTVTDLDAGEIPRLEITVGERTLYLNLYEE